MSKSYMTRENAVKHLANFFSKTSQNSVTRRAALLAAGRDPANWKWFSYITTAMGEHELFTKTYTANGTLDKLVLTEAGKRALGRGQGQQSILSSNKTAAAVPTTVPTSNAPAITPEYAHSIVQQLARQNPSFRVGLIFEPKERPIE